MPHEGQARPGTLQPPRGPHGVPATAEHGLEQERQRVYEQTGLRVTDHGVQHPPTIIHCPRPGCLFTATARNEGRAVRALSAHLVHHIRKEQGQ